MIMVLAITVVGYVVAQILQTPINNLVGVADKTLPGDITEATLITIVSAMVPVATCHPAAPGSDRQCPEGGV
jgi:hypothetical protein